MGNGVYQSQDYKKALEKDVKIVGISDDFFSIEKEIKFSKLGKKKVIEARGNVTKDNLDKFKEKADNYLYGIISPCVVDLKENLFEKLGYFKVVNHTILIDLNQGEDQLWKNLEKKSARWGVKTAKKNELIVEKDASESDIDKFYKLYQKTSEDGGFDAESKEFLKSLANSDVAQLFLVKKDKKIIAGGLVLLDGDNNYTILDLTAASEDGLKLQAMPLLYWEMVLFSKEKGFDVFDLGGYDDEAKKGDKTYNVNKFKERFGGDVVEQPIYSTNKKYVFLRGLLKKARFMKGLYQKIG